MTRPGLPTWLTYVWQGLLVLVLLTALLRIEAALHALDVAVMRLDYHLLLQRISADDGSQSAVPEKGGEP